MNCVYKILILLAFTLLCNSTFAQENTKAKCEDLMDSGYISDGKKHIAKLDLKNKAKFYTTFYGGSSYRIIGCTDMQDYKLIITVFDTERNILFCNKNHDYTPYWNFTFTSTLDCIIEFEFDCEKELSEEVQLLIGFKEK